MREVIETPSGTPGCRFEARFAIHTAVPAGPERDAAAANSRVIEWIWDGVSASGFDFQQAAQEAQAKGDSFLSECGKSQVFGGAVFGHGNLRGLLGRRLQQVDRFLE